MKILCRYIPEIDDMFICSSDGRNKICLDIIKAGISSREITRDMVKVRSSNVWAYKINIKKNGDKFGDVYVQFKGKNGGPEDIYVYYDVPVKVFRRWISAPSKGHYFWVNIRNNYSYSKLTGDKRGKLKNAIN